MQSPSPNINNKEPIDEEIRKVIKKLRNNKPSLDIESELLKIKKNFSMNSIKFLNFIKNKRNEKHTTQKVEFINS